MKNLRVLFLAGPGDAKAAFQSWAKGDVLPDITTYGYSHLMFDACKDLDVPLLALTTHENPADARSGDISVECIENVFSGRQGITYHLAHLRFLRLLIREIRRFKANVVVLGGEPYGFLLFPLTTMGIKVVMSHHCVLWPYFEPRSAQSKILFRAQRNFYRKGAYAVLSASHMITSQVREVAGQENLPIVEFFPKFRSKLFEVLPPPEQSKRPFRFTFVGRAEANKGVFDLVEVARRLKFMGRNDIVIDLCGTGSATSTLEKMVSDEGLSEWLILHGWCGAEKLRDIHARSHAALIPTQTGFIEGFNQALVEALLSGRPVISSKVCPAVEYMEAGVCLATPNDADSYLEFMLRMVDDQDFYEELRANCREVGKKCLGDEYSFGAAVHHILLAARDDQSPKPRYIPRLRPIT